MLHIKRIIIFALSVIFLSINITDGCNIVYAEEQEKKDLERGDFLRSIGALYDVPDDETEDLTKLVSRAEFAKIIVKYYNLPYISMEIDEKPYIDVEVTNEYVRDIKTLKEFGYIVDSEKLKFRPNDIITLNEAGIMIVKGLGYKDLSDNVTYKMAVDLKLYRGIESNGKATLNNIYIMLENALNAGMVEMEFKNGTVKYSSSKEKTVLSEVYKAKKMRGIVTANTLTGLSSAEDCVDDSQLSIDGKRYNSNNKLYGKYLGYVVDFYLTDDEDILYLTPYTDNEIISIDSEDIVSADNTKLVYAKSNRKTTLKLDVNFDVIYNRKSYSGYGTLNNILPEDGNIVAIDNNDDGKIDVVNITSYKYYVVNDVYSEDNKVYTANENEALDFSEDYDTEFKNTDGNNVSFSAIKKDSVLSVEESRNTEGVKFISAIVSDNKVDGVITSIDEDCLEIDGKEFLATKNFMNKAIVGTEGTFFIAHNGKIVYYKAAGNGSWNIGMVYKTYLDDEHDNQLYIYIYTSDGEFIKYPTRKKIKVSATTQIPSGVEGWENVGHSLSEGEIIRYRINNENEISLIEKADEGYKAENSYHYVNEQGLRILGSATSSYYYRNGLFDGKIATDADTLFFVQPPKDKWDNKDLFYTTSKSILRNNVYEYSGSYQAYAFGSGDVSYAGIVVLPDVEVSSSSIQNEGCLYTISKIGKVISNDDEVYNQLIVYGNGEKCIYYCCDDILQNYQLEEGDIVQLETDAERKIIAIRKIVNADSSSSISSVLIPGVKNSNGTTPTKDVLYSGLICYGTIAGKSDKYIEYTYIGNEKYLGIMSRAKITKIEKYNNKSFVSNSKYDDVSVGDKFVAVISSGEVRDMVIYK